MQCHHNLYRFVILHHATSTGEHWDVMLESDDALLTWSIAPQNPLGADFDCSAVPLWAHRKFYLDYEGEIGQNRGKVTKIDAGTYQQLAPETFRLHGTLFIGILTLQDDRMMFVSDRPANSPATESTSHRGDESTPIRNMP